MPVAGAHLVDKKSRIISGPAAVLLSACPAARAASFGAEVRRLAFDPRWMNRARTGSWVKIFREGCP